MEVQNSKGFSTAQLKYIAIIAMLIDHIAWAFVPTASLLGELMHIVGRLTAPIMCFFIAEGFYHTRNVKKYFLRLFIFALISHVAFVYYEFGKFPIMFRNGDVIILGKLTTSVIFTLMLGLVALIIWKKTNWNIVIKIVCIILISVIACIGDWAFLAVLWILFFGIFRGDKKKQMISFSLIGIMAWLAPTLMNMSNPNYTWWRNVFQLGIYLSIPLLLRYNGEHGGSKSSKWIFYIFYPLHLFVLGFLRFVVFK